MPDCQQSCATFPACSQLKREVYTREIDYFEKQQELSDISQWMKRNPLIDQNEEQSAPLRANRDSRAWCGWRRSIQPRASFRNRLEVPSCSLSLRSRSDWVHAFEKWVVTNNFYDRTYPVPTKQAFYTMLHDFFRSDAGSFLREIYSTLGFSRSMFKKRDTWPLLGSHNHGILGTFRHTPLGTLGRQQRTGPPFPSAVTT